MSLARLPSPRPSRLSASKLAEGIGFVTSTLRGAPELCAVADKSLPMLAQRHSCFAVVVMADALSFERERVGRDIDADDFFDITDEAWAEVVRRRDFRDYVGGWARSRRVQQLATSGHVCYSQAAFAFVPMVHPCDGGFDAIEPDYWRVLWRLVSMRRPEDAQPVACAMWLPESGAPKPRPVFMLPHSGVPFPLQDRRRVVTSGGEVRSALALARQRPVSRSSRAPGRLPQ